MKYKTTIQAMVAVAIFGGGYWSGLGQTKARTGKPVVHFEIGCRDLEKTGKFYRELFDWSVEQQGPAAVISTGSPAGIGGHMTALGHEPFDYTMFYVEVDDIKGYLSKVKALGGTMIVPPVPIPTGQFAWFRDPEGNLIGLLQPKM